MLVWLKVITPVKHGSRGFFPRYLEVSQVLAPVTHQALPSAHPYSSQEQSWSIHLPFTWEELAQSITNSKIFDKINTKIPKWCWHWKSKSWESEKIMSFFICRLVTRPFLLPGQGWWGFVCVCVCMCFTITCNKICVCVSVILQLVIRFLVIAKVTL